MSWPIDRLDARLRTVVYGSKRISERDAARQHKTVSEILDRLGRQPGVVLADEVGMGKTFVALGAALIAAEADERRNPSIIMIPSGLRQKWPRDAKFFRDHCVVERDTPPRFERAATALEFLRLLDEPAHRRAHAVFLNHNAFHLTAIDPWTKLAIIQRAMRNKWLGHRRSALPKFVARIIRIHSRLRDPDLFGRLLREDYAEWRAIINAFRPDENLTYDPVPRRVAAVLDRANLDFTELQDALLSLPVRESANVGERILRVRQTLGAGLRIVWPRVLKEARFRAPLLVVDEAHHLKNAQTRLASLFAEEDEAAAAGRSDGLYGALDGRFERMLFLTATPFQLGHDELVEVLRRFRAIAWSSLPSRSPETYDRTLDDLKTALDNAQQTALGFDRLWQQIPSQLVPAPGDDAKLDNWWADLLAVDEPAEPILAEVKRAYRATDREMHVAEGLLRPWVIRHRREDRLPRSETPRRLRRIGESIRAGKEGSRSGLSVAEDQLLPFLLAARAQSVADRLSMQTGERYTVFADGLASSYEAFLETSDRRSHLNVDDEEGTVRPEPDARLQEYLRRLKGTLPVRESYGRHPKIAAVVARALALWERGEKVVVFCHFRKTGHALLEHLSRAVEGRLWTGLAERTGHPRGKLRRATLLFGNRFDPGAPMAKYLNSVVNEMLAEHYKFGASERKRLHDVVRRFVRSPMFVARYFDPMAQSSVALLDEALATKDQSALTLRERLRSFIEFCGTRDPVEREEYLGALETVQPGLRGALDQNGEDPAVVGTSIPNIRLVNGATRQEARQRLLLSFNTPFFPDILVASSVLAEGVDLHLNCRYIIHHDLSWNPSNIEQRTGRVDRIECKAEKVGLPIEVFLPFVAETQDEKQYKVVMDRERWFQVLMGEDYQLDDITIDRLAARVPLPPAAARALSLNLEVFDALCLSGADV